MNNTRDRIKGLYAIADAKWNPFDKLETLVEEFLKGGCRLIQLRAKPDGVKVKDLDHSRLILFNAGKQCVKLKAGYNFTLIINDFADIATKVGADGVHVGENDEPVAKIKSIYNDKLIVGFSSHSVDEAKSAIDDGADYVAIGAVFPTKTKGPGHPIVGIDALRALCKSVSVPVVAIGGINTLRAREALDAGAGAVAVITALSEAKSVSRATEEFIRSI